MLTFRDVTKLLKSEQLEKENIFYNRLTATVSHEMMTPLNCIITFARSLFGTQFDKKAKQIVNVAQLVKMNLKDLLDRSQLENGKLVPYMESCSLYSLMQ